MRFPQKWQLGSMIETIELICEGVLEKATHGVATYAECK